MSILSAIKQQNSSIDDLAALPQALIMQMAQKKQISEEMLAPILSRKAELADAFARQNALQNAGQTPPTVMEQLLAQNAQAEQPQIPQEAPQQMPPQMAPQEMAPQMPEDAGVAQLPLPDRQYAGGGIIAFADGGMSDFEDDDYEDSLEEADYDAMIQAAMNEDDAEPSRYTGAGISAGRAPKERESGDLEARLRSAIMGKESGGRRYDKNGNLLTSHKGAQGEMQVMPLTAKDPGFGIKPAQSNDPNELRRVGDEYASVLLKRYRDPKLAMIAYNMGPGATDKWLSAGADPRRLPKETQGYISNVNLAKGGEVQHFANQGYVGFGEEAPYDPNDPSLYDTIGDMFGSPLERLKSSIYGVGATTAKERQQAMKEKKAAPAKPTTQNAVKPSGAPTDQDFQNFDQATALYLAENAGKAAPAQAQEAPKSPFDLYMEKMLAREEAGVKQRADDKNMAMLTAGLGMLGGSSPYAFENIGKGALAGVQHLSESNKQRAAEQSALDKSILYATRYKGADEIAKQNAAFNQRIKEGTLSETARANTNKEIEHAQTNLNQWLRVQQDMLKSRFPAGEADPAYQTALSQIYQRPEYRTLAQRAGYTIEQPTFAGFSAKMR